MNKKTLVIAVIVVVAIVAVAVGVYLATLGGGGGGGGGGGANVAGASSLQFSVTVTHEGVSEGTYKYMAKNAGESNMMIRIEWTPPQGETTIWIVNRAQQKAWMYSDGQWQDLTSMFTDQWNAWKEQWQGYKNNLADWTGAGDWKYTAPNGDTVRIYDISVNPSLADSLFQP